MYLSRIILRDIRAFKELDLSFVASNGKPRNWTLLLGDNATGKTALLRSIAMGLSDESSAAGLARELKGHLLRNGSRAGEIVVELQTPNGLAWTIETKFEKLERTGELVRQRVFKSSLSGRGAKQSEVALKTFPWKDLFVVGYGAGRTTEGREEYDEYRTVDAVYTLFRYDQPLQSPELAWRRMLDFARRKAQNSASGAAQRREKQLDRQIEETLHEILLLKESERIHLEPTGIRVAGPQYSAPLLAHADGYKSTTMWVLDLLAWRMLFAGEPSFAGMAGVVLVDELEQHLHPRWQRYIVSRLRSQFPRLQFVATTHSPLCSGGAADLSEDECQLVSLKRDGQKIQHEVLPLQRGMRADQVLTSDAFELPDTRNPKVAVQIARLHELFRKRELRSKEKRELARLRLALQFVPEAAQTADEQRLKKDLRELVKQLEKKLKQPE